MISCNVMGIISRTSESLWNEAPQVRDCPPPASLSRLRLGKVTRCETAAAGLDNASIGKDRWIGGYGTSWRGRPYRRPKNPGDGGYEAKTGTLAGALHWLPQPSRGGEGRCRLSGRPCQRAAVESTLRQICARSLACFGRGQALAPACKGDQGLVGNWIFRGDPRMSLHV